MCFCGIYNWHIQKCPVILTLNCQPLAAPLRRFYCMSTPCRATFCPFIYACMVCLSILLYLPTTLSSSLSLFLCRFLLIFLSFFFKSDNHSPLSGCQVSGRAFVSLYLCVKMTLHTHTHTQLHGSTATAGYGYRALELKSRLKLKLRNCFRGYTCLCCAGTDKTGKHKTTSVESKELG